MITFLMLAVIWTLVLFFVSAEIYVRRTRLKAFVLSTTLNLFLFMLCSIIWLFSGTDGFGQLYGVLIYGVIFAAYLLLTGFIFFLLNRAKRKGTTTNNSGAS